MQGSVLDKGLGEKLFLSHTYNTHSTHSTHTCTHAHIGEHMHTHREMQHTSHSGSNRGKMHTF